MIAINEGKKFETSFKNSVLDTVYFQRINDPAQSFNQSNTLRFSLQNPYDCFMYYFPNLFTLELKSTKQSSLTFFREDFLEKGKKKTFMVKKNQIEGLSESSKHKGVISGLILNFRNTNRTYFLHINDFKNMTEILDKKSFNEEDVINNNGHLIEQTLKKVNYKYNIEKFIFQMQEKYN